MSRRPGDSQNKDLPGGWLGVIAGIGTGILLYSAYRNGVFDETAHQYSDTDKVIADTEAKCRSAADIIRRHCTNFNYLGLDCLWTNYHHNIRKPVGLLQLATAEGFCVIVRLCDLQNNISTELKDILKDTAIFKVGVNIDQNVGFIKSDHNVVVRGTIDLSRLAHEASIAERSLSKLAASVCLINVKKPKAYKTVDWSKNNLTKEEIEYAQNRAIAAIKVFEKLRETIIERSGVHYYSIIIRRLARTD